MNRMADSRTPPGVYAIDRPSLVFIGARCWISILPPRWIKNFRSEWLMYSTHWRDCIILKIAWMWSTPSVSILKSLIIPSNAGLTTSIALRIPPRSEMLRVKAHIRVPLLKIFARTMILLLAFGCWKCWRVMGVYMKRYAIFFEDTIFFRSTEPSAWPTFWLKQKNANHGVWLCSTRRF